MCQLTDDTKDPCDQDSPEDTAFDIFGKEDRSNKDTDQCKQYCDSLRRKCSFCNGRFEGKDADKCRIISDNDLCILQSDKCDKETNTYGYCMFQVHRDGVEDCFTHICKRK